MKFNTRTLAELTKFEFSYPQIRRWVVAFLPPDPKAGRQSGKSRQYGIDDVFIIVFGGHIVAFLRYKIPEAQRVVGDVVEWLRKNKGMPTQIYDFSAPLETISPAEMLPYDVDGKWWKRLHEKFVNFDLHIEHRPDGTRSYTVREFLTTSLTEPGIFDVRYREYKFGEPAIEHSASILHHPRHTIALSRIRDLLLARMPIYSLVRENA